MTCILSFLYFLEIFIFNNCFFNILFIHVQSPPYVYIYSPFCTLNSIYILLEIKPKINSGINIPKLFCSLRNKNIYNQFTILHIKLDLSETYCLSDTRQILSSGKSPVTAMNEKSKSYMIFSMKIGMSITMVNLLL